MGQCAYQSESQSESHLTLPERVPERESEPVPLSGSVRVPEREPERVPPSRSACQSESQSQHPSGSVRVPEREPERAHPDPPLHLTCTPNFILRLLPFTPPPPPFSGRWRAVCAFIRGGGGRRTGHKHPPLKLGIQPTRPTKRRGERKFLVGAEKYAGAAGQNTLILVIYRGQGDHQVGSGRPKAAEVPIETTRSRSRTGDRW